MTEIFPLVNENGVVIGKATRQECHSGSFLLHPVVHLHVFNSRGQLYLQKRALNKDIQPGKWDTSVGGHVGYYESIEEITSVEDCVGYDESIEETISVEGHVGCDETIEAALRREALEELGIQGFEAIYLGKYTYRSDREFELVNSFYTVFDGDISPDPGEISEGRFWDISEIRENIGKNVFTPNFEHETGVFVKLVGLKI